MMASFNSITKCQTLVEEKANLLSQDSETEDFSSGYDSPEYFSDEDTERKRSNRFLQTNSSDKSDFSSDKSTLVDNSSSKDEGIYKFNDINSMKVTNVHTLIDNIRYILSMPDLCDVVFIVGPQRVPVYGLKAILSTRSRLFFVMFLKHSKEAMKQKKKMKKTKHTKPEQSNTLTFTIDNYDADIFRTFLLFVHCGTVEIEPPTVTGLLCLATEFDIPDLRSSCWEFIDRCLSVQSFSSVMMKETLLYGHHKAAQKLRIKVKF
ncbi:serine-enriched protein-like [Mytilus trossulus]|uniref:serine-enriched protein-like n=1 Tax=Mytilus trossulus TaxID=6551 RepID=UPI003006F826